MQTQTQSYYAMFKAHRTAMLETMQANYDADLAAGYSVDGESLTRQREAIRDYAAATAHKLAWFACMTNTEREENAWFLLKISGVIS